MDPFAFDPVRGLLEVLFLLAFIGLIVLAISYRRRVLKLLTGDERIHFTCLDAVVYTCFSGCCGTFSCDWTRSITKCWLCPAWIRGKNLFDFFGKYVGLTHYTIEVKNFVVGDLPVDGRGDFYLQVLCEANPPMNTSLAEKQLPKVVHFPEVLTLKVRWSHLEEQVRINVKDLNMLGSNTICTASIRATDVVNWARQADPKERTKRIEMKPFDADAQVLTQPWILLEFDEPSDLRDLDNFHGNPNTVRTSTRTGFYRDAAVSKFKHSYALLDPNGNRIEEPFEEDLEEIHRWRRCLVGGTNWFILLVAIAILAYVLVRIYVSECRQGYTSITTAVLLGKDLPVSRYELHRTVKNCTLLFAGTGIGKEVRDNPCRPTEAQVMDVCRSNKYFGNFSQAQPRPNAFTPTLLNGVFQQLGIGVWVPGLSCGGTYVLNHTSHNFHMCDMIPEARVWDATAILGCCLLLFIAVACSCCARSSFAEYKNSLLQQRSMEMISQSESSRRQHRNGYV